MTLPFSKSRAFVCDSPVTNAVEGYSPRDGRAHGSIDRVVYVCPDHVEDGRRLTLMEWELTPYTAIMVGTAGADFKSRCGEVTDWTTTSEVVVSEEQACGCGGEGCDTCGGTYVMTVPGQSVSEGPADEHQEHGGPGTDLQK
jgi:hypothetical protein